MLDKKWEKVHAKVKAQYPDFVEPDYPFKSSNLIREFNELYAKIYDKEKFI